jgi:2-haloacid dehalogenase
MSRRDFLKLLPAGALSSVAGAFHAGCAASPRTPPLLPAPPAPRRRIRAICFDLFTLFDPRDVVRTAATVLPGGAAEFCEAWRTRQFEYCWLRASAGQYADFRTVTRASLAYVAKARGVTLTNAAEHTLVEAYTRLPAWPDAEPTLAAFRSRGLKLAPLANYAPDMIEALLRNARLDAYFDDRISTHAARTFKPDPRAYGLGPLRLGFEKEAIAFSAFGGWDAAGAKWFGFPTFWVNRLGVPAEELVAPDATGSTLAELDRFVTSWAEA